MRLRFHPAAVEESVEAGCYYDRQQVGLGAEFDSALQTGINAILENPIRWPAQTNETRRFLLKRFPYGIVYTLHEQTITVIAVMHLRRRRSTGPIGCNNTPEGVTPECGDARSATMWHSRPRLTSTSSVESCFAGGATI
jgi:hypothetical protein